MKPTAPRKTKLTDSGRIKILGALLLRSNEGKLERGDLSALVAEEGIDTSAISRLWTRAKAEMARTGHYASPQHRCRSGRLAVDHSQMFGRLRGIDVEERSTFTSVVKLVLTEANNHQHFQYSLSHIQRDAMLFDSMVDTVHVDEKLFNITQPTRRFFLLPDDEDCLYAACGASDTSPR
ncbi:Mar19 Transposase [Phytophthora palmivora]|uniref:Mar19 Transposase n=1 Tax=Phytophthora palmivora TaxID=4796 RepID=A0A2P4YKZ9_9STRA|nr:Mar19 Transposase [Phytophthora palmivora]